MQNRPVNLVSRLVRRRCRSCSMRLPGSPLFPLEGRGTCQVSGYAAAWLGAAVHDQAPGVISIAELDLHGLLLRA